MLVLVPSSDTPHSRTWLPYEIATILEDASPPPPCPILALMAILSMQLSI
jgi:hypothetical protein